MTYRNTFILVADDCPVTEGAAPVPKAGKPTIASLAYDLLSRNPYKFTQDDLILEVHARRNNLPAEEFEARRAEIREKLFQKPHPCMRASPLPKSYGWGAHHDEAGRIAIFAVGSREYAMLSKGKDVTVLKAMRNKRA